MKDFFFENKVFNGIVLIVAFIFLFFLSNLLFISVISFFHFILGHSFSVIEQWISDNIWQIAFLSKTLSAYLFMLIFRTRWSFLDIKNQYLKIYNISPDYKLYVVISLWLGSFLLFNEFNLSQHWDFALSIYFSFFFVAFHVLDFAIVSFIGSQCGIKRELETLIFCGAYSILNYLVFNSISTKIDGAPLSLSVEFFLVLYLFFRYKSYYASFLFIILFLLPINIYWDLAPLVLPEEVPLFLFQSNISALLYVVLLVISIFYLRIKRRW